MSSFFESSNLELGYGNQVVISNLKISLEASKNYEIIGKNGSGKTTLLMCISNNFIGNIFNSDIKRINNSLIEIGAVSSLIPKLSLIENINYFLYFFTCNILFNKFHFFNLIHQIFLINLIFDSDGISFFPIYLNNNQFFVKSQILFLCRPWRCRHSWRRKPGLHHHRQWQQNPTRQLQDQKTNAWTKNYSWNPQVRRLGSMAQTWVIRIRDQFCINWNTIRWCFQMLRDSDNLLKRKSLLCQ